MCRPLREQARHQNQQRRIRRGRRELHIRGVRPHGRRQGIQPRRAEQQRRRQLLHRIQEHQRKRRPQCREDNRQRDPAKRAERRRAQRARSLFQLRCRLVQRRADRRLGQRQKQQCISDQQQGGGLVQRWYVVQGEIHQGQRNHQAGQGVQQVRQAFGPDRQLALVAHDQQPDWHRQYQAQCCAAQGQRQGRQQRLTNLGHRECCRRAHCQPVAEHPQRNPAADDRQHQAIRLAERGPLAQANLLGMPRRALADAYVSTFAACAQLQP